MVVGWAHCAGEALDLDGGAGVLVGRGRYVAVATAGSAVDGHHSRVVGRCRSEAGLARLPGGGLAPNVVVGDVAIAPVAIAWGLAVLGGRWSCDGCRDELLDNAREAVGEAKALWRVDILVSCNPKAGVVYLLGGVLAGDLGVDAQVDAGRAMMGVVKAENRDRVPHR